MNMAGKRFVEAANRKVESGYDRPDRIPETDKVRTYCYNSMGVFSGKHIGENYQQKAS